MKYIFNNIVKTVANYFHDFQQAVELALRRKPGFSQIASGQRYAISKLFLGVNFNNMQHTFMLAQKQNLSGLTSGDRRTIPLSRIGLLFEKHNIQIFSHRSSEDGGAPS